MHFRKLSRFLACITMSTISLVTGTVCLAQQFEKGTKATIWLLPHSHYDVAWLDTEDVTAKRIAAVLHGHINLATKEDTYRFVLDQVPEIEALMKHYPKDIPILKDLVAQGRAQIVGGLYIQPDENLPEGETLLQTGVYGQQWIKENFGIYSNSAFDIDSFGHSAQMPQILNSVGITQQAFARLGDRSNPRLDVLNWHGLDGSSSVITEYMSQQYGAGGKINPMTKTDKIIETIMDVYQKLAKRAVGTDVLIPVGDDYAPAPKYLPKAVKEWNAANSEIKMNICTLKDYMDTVGQSPQVRDFTGEFNRVFSGNYSARIWIKQQNRKLEHALLSAERLSVMASRFGYEYPEDTFKSMWKDLITNQFHDLLPATALDHAYNKAQSRYRSIEASLRQITSETMEFLSNKVSVNNSLASLTVVNQLGFNRSDICIAELDSRLQNRSFKLVDSKGTEIPYQLLDNSGIVSIAFYADVQSLGYHRYYFIEGIPSWDPHEKVSAVSAVQRHLTRYDMIINEQGGIKYLKHNTTGNIVIDTRDTVQFRDTAGNELSVYSDNSNAYFHDGNPTFFTSTEDEEQKGTLFSGPVMDRIVYEGTISGSKLNREIRFYSSTDRIDFITTVDWRGEREKIMVAFPTKAAGSTYEEIPYGVIKRTDGQFPVIKWADKGNESWGVALLNKGLPDYTVSRSNLSITLLRSIDYTFNNSGDSPGALGKKHLVFEYSLLPHSGAWASAMVPQAAWAYNEPLLAAFDNGESKGTTAAGQDSWSLGSVDGSGILTALRIVGGQIEARIQEPFAKQSSTAVTIAGSTSAAWTDALGRPLQQAEPGPSFETEMRPQEIKTIKVSLDK